MKKSFKQESEELNKAKVDEGYLPAKKRQMREERQSYLSHEERMMGVNIPTDNPGTSWNNARKIKGPAARANQARTLAQLKEMPKPKLSKDVDMGNGEPMAMSEKKSYRDMKKTDKLAKEHIGFKALQHKLEAEGHSEESAKKIAASIGRKKYGAKGMAAKSKAGMHKNEELEHNNEPEEDDIFFHPTGPLGARTSVSAGGKHIGEFHSDEEAHAAAKAWSKKNGYYPNAWQVSDHGNHEMIENFHAEPKATKMKKTEMKPGMSLRQLKKAEEDYAKHVEGLVKALPETASKAKEIVKKIKK